HPIRKAGPQGVAQVTFPQPSGRHGINGLAVAAQQAEVTQNMLPVFSTWPDERLSIVRSDGPMCQVPDIREKVSPLSSQQIDQVYPLSLTFQNGGGRGEEMHMGVRGPPATLPQVCKSGDFELELPLPGRDLHLLADGRIFKPLRHLHENLA